MFSVSVCHLYTLASINQRPPALPHRGYNWSLFCLCVSFLSPVTVTQVLCFLSFIHVFVFIVCVWGGVYLPPRLCVVQMTAYESWVFASVTQVPGIEFRPWFQVSLPLSLLTRPPLSLCCWWIASPLSSFLFLGPA